MIITSKIHWLFKIIRAFFTKRPTIGFIDFDKFLGRKISEQEAYYTMECVEEFLYRLKKDLNKNFYFTKYTSQCVICNTFFEYEVEIGNIVRKHTCPKCKELVGEKLG